ncbi:MAG: hypothetical protein HYY28_16640 [Betaproteobacteria bacterium]|nr:hypothetical protein [Betaproteobacteria bacterium]
MPYTHHIPGGTSPQEDGTPGEATVTMLNLQMNHLGPTVPVDNIMVEVVR